MKLLKLGRVTVKGMPFFGLPSTFLTDENIIKVKDLVFELRHSRVRGISGELDIGLVLGSVLAQVVPIIFQKQYFQQFFFGHGG